ncbi:hypothetical protein AVEN_157916-1 [Araneus ventricosus]|uniref:DUF4817 domain-containing protein n=1 Tax=Araneus ventricosus TaxID=182803 RepID=A0A4Y2LDG9_ARAVE|nr:hypothetical protein AVEN_157916-1 [Araneus ventricosus]
MAAMQERSLYVLEYAKCSSVTSVQRAFLIKYGKAAPGHLQYVPETWIALKPEVTDESNCFMGWERIGGTPNRPSSPFYGRNTPAWASITYPTPSG